MAATRILILSDGRPGHYHLSEGIALAVGRLGPTIIERRTVSRGRWPGPVLSALINSGVPPQLILERIYGLRSQALPRADLIISAGAETLAANIAIAQFQGAPNVFYGSLRRFRARDFALVLTSYARQVDATNRVMTLKPAAFDPGVVGSTVAGRLAGTNLRLGLVIGGPAPGYRFASTDWAALEALVDALASRCSASFVISNSRRTPTEVSERISNLARRLPERIVRFIDVRQPGSPRLIELLQDVEAVLVTADSSSMISEAVWARRGVVALAPSRARPTPDEASYRTYLAQNDWATECTLDETEPEGLLRCLARVQPMTANPLDGLAGLLGKHIPALATSSAVHNGRGADGPTVAQGSLDEKQS